MKKITWLYGSKILTTNTHIGINYIVVNNGIHMSSRTATVGSDVLRNKFRNSSLTNGGTS